MVINREVGAQGKGFRLQRLRAIKLLIEKILENKEAYVATEFLDDVYVKAVDSSSIQEIAESDKNYASRDTFTFATEEVRNSIVGFFDTWVENGMRKDSLFFCFYTNIGIGKERNSGIVKSLGLELPSKPLINCLEDKEYVFRENIGDQEKEFNILDITKAILVKEYENQYAGKAEPGNYEILKKLDEELYKSFLESIDWQFEQANEEELEEILKIELRNFSNSGVSIEGREHLVISALLDEFEKKQTIPDLYSRFVTHDIFTRILLEVATLQYKLPDPIAEMWDKVEKPEDTRIVREKILDVCPEFNIRRISMYERKIATVRVELNDLGLKDRLGYKSYMYRIFSASDERLFDLKDSKTEEFSEELIKSWLDDLFKYSLEKIDDKSKDYIIPLKNKDSLQNTVLELFDSCYLQFEEV